MIFLNFQLSEGWSCTHDRHWWCLIWPPDIISIVDGSYCVTSRSPFVPTNYITNIIPPEKVVMTQMLCFVSNFKHCNVLHIMCFTYNSYARHLRHFINQMLVCCRNVSRNIHRKFYRRATPFMKGPSMKSKPQICKKKFFDFLVFKSKLLKEYCLSNFSTNADFQEGKVNQCHCIVPYDVNNDFKPVISYTK